MRRLNCGNGAIFGRCDFDQLLRRSFWVAANVKMIANQKEKWLPGGKFARAENGVAVTARLRLFDELQMAALCAGGGSVSFLVAGANDHADFLDASRKDFLNDNA